MASLRRILLALLVILALPAVVALVMTFREPGDLWATTRVFPGCPTRPSCVSSMATDAAHRVPPLAYRGDAAAARTELENVIRALPLTSIERATPDYLHVVFRTPTMRFRDDVELLIEPAGIIHVRSISRFGYHDQGVNGERVELLRERTAHIARAKRD